LQEVLLPAVQLKYKFVDVLQLPRCAYPSLGGHYPGLQVRQDGSILFEQCLHNSEVAFHLQLLDFKRRIHLEIDQNGHEQ